MHILRNTGKRIVFPVYNVLIGEISFEKITKLWILSFYVQNNTFIYVEPKKNTNFLWAYTFFEVYI